jgi:serine/threonine-protein kinase
VLLAPIGAGGMGEVWKARDTRLGRIVAVKRLKGQHSTRFEQEARAIAALNHPHICQIHDIGPDYLVLEYIEGQPLKGPLVLDEAVRLAVQIAEALVALKRKGVVHRDLKPANIMVTSEGSAKLLDFGLAKLVTNSDETATIEGTVMGTAAYMAPEQVEGKPLDSRSDIFSFGAVLYELLSGRRAFRGENSISTMAAILHKEPAPLDAPAQLRGIVKRCLAKPPGQRYQTMAEIRAALESISGKTEQQPSVAILPFANMSRDADDEYFSDGLAEEILNVLAQVAGLKVIARTSAFAFKGKNEDIRKIAEALGVTNVLEGSVRRSGNRLRVNAQLIHAADGTHLWSQRFDREMTDVFAMQDEIAQAIADALKGKLSAQPLVRQRYTPKLPAYEAVLKAWHHEWKFTPESVERGRECYEQAIAIDPDFALAHSGYAHHFFIMSVIGLRPPHEVMPLMRTAARKAVDLDPSLSEAHGLLAVVAAVYDYDWKEAERRFRLATSRDPVPPMVRIWHGYWFLEILGQSLEALAEQERALQEDPLNVVVRFGLAASLIASGRHAEGDAHLRQAEELDEKSWQAPLNLGLSLTSQVMLEEALTCAERAYSLAPWSGLCQGLLAGVLVRTGDRSRVEGLLQELRHGQGAGGAPGLTIFNLVWLETDQAADWAEKAIEQRDPRIGITLRHPLAEALRASSRWPLLARMMNLPFV